MFDFHMHLTRQMQPELVFQELTAKNIQFTTVACEPWEWSATQLLSLNKFANICYGIHPSIAKNVCERNWLKLENLLLNKNAQIGECGLDKRFYGYEPGGVQEIIFEKQIRIAQKLNRNLQIHCVGDYMRVIKIILKNWPNLNQSKARIIFHRFSGDASVIKFANKLNAIFSLHISSFKKKSTLEAIRKIPTNLIYFETDADETFINNATNLPPLELAKTIANKIETSLHELQKFYTNLIKQ